MVAVLFGVFGAVGCVAVLVFCDVILSPKLVFGWLSVGFLLGFLLGFWAVLG